jgi:integrase
MFVEQWRDRHGKIRVYFRRGKGARIPLPSDMRSEAFAAAYGKAVAGQASQPSPRSQAAPRDTLAWLIDSYRRSAAYLELRASTKRGYDTRLDAIRGTHGSRSVSGLTRERIIAAFLQPYAESPGARLDVLKKLRILIRHAIDVGALKHDPSKGIKRPKTHEIRSWTDGETEAFEARWPAGSKERLAFALFLYTGQRVSDIHRMTWADVRNGTIRVVQQKTGEKLTIPLHSALAALIETTKREHVAIITTAYGRPFTVKGFGQWMRAAITAAGLPLDCQPHGLRKAAGRRLAEAGCTAKEIMAVLGHRTLAEAERYTRDADQPLLASAALLKLETRTKERGT